MAIEVRIKQEEMKLKACSDETKQKLDLTKAGLTIKLQLSIINHIMCGSLIDIEEIRDGLLEKIKEYQKETNIEIRMFKGESSYSHSFRNPH